MNEAIFVTWRDHRRSRELAKMLAIRYVVLRGAPWLKALQTVMFLFRERKRVLLVQNPSLILTTLACALMRLTGTRVIQDLHSYFSLHIHEARGLRARVYRALSRFCIRRATLTIVTNPELQRVVEALGGRALVLQDAIPEFPAFESTAPAVHRRIVFVCTYSADEPVEEVLQAAAALPANTRIYITGRTPARMRRKRIPSNVVLTGFLPEDEYLALLRAAHAVLVLTTREHTLLCGAYEALAFHKPLILSDTRALRGYFADAAVYVRNDPASIARAIADSFHCSENRMADIVNTLKANWQHGFAQLRAEVSHVA